MARDPWASPRVILFAPPFSFHFTIHKILFHLILANQSLLYNILNIMLFYNKRLKKTENVAKKPF